MDNNYIKEITLDLSATNQAQYVDAKQGDDASRFLRIRLLEDGADYALGENEHAVLRVAKPDHTTAMVEAVPDDEGVLDVELSEQCLAAAGEARADVAILGENGGVLSTATFYIRIEKAAVWKGVVSKNEIKVLMDYTAQAISSAIDAAAAKKEAEAQAAAAKAAADDAAASLAETENVAAVASEEMAAKLDAAQKAAAEADLMAAHATDAAEAAEAAAAEAKETAKTVNAEEIQKQIEMRGDNLWKDPTTGLLYLMSGEKKLGDGVAVGSGNGTGGGLAFDSGYMDEGGYLHLTLDGEDIEGFTPFYVGTGGSGTGAGSVLKVTCSLASRVFSILDSDENCPIIFTWSSTDADDGSSTGKGSATWTVNGTRAAVQKGLEQGEVTFDIRKYLTDGAENDVILTVSDAYGNEKPLVFTITVTSFGLTWNQDEMAYHKTDAMEISMEPKGSGDKTVKVSVDGDVVYDQVISTTGRTIRTAIGPLSHGAHTIMAWVEIEVEGETMSTTPLRHIGIWTEEGNTAKTVAVLDEELTVSQYGTAAVRFMVVDPENEVAQVELKSNGTTVAVLADVSRAVQTWAYKAKTVGVETLAVVSGTASDEVALTVTGLGYEISPVTVGLVLDIDPSGHSNTEAGRENFGYTDANGANHPFTFSDNFDWERGGFRQDDDGIMAFVVKRGCYVTADCSLFTNDVTDTGKNIKLIFKSTNVRNYDAELLNCRSGNVGLVLQAQQATVGSELETMTVPYCEGRKIEMDVNIQSQKENALAYICMKAVPSAPPVKWGSTDSWTQTAPKMLTIGSEDADVWIYRIKMYGNSLNRFEILDNYVADCGDTEEMVERFLRNDVFNTDGTISIPKLTEKNTKLRAVHIKAQKMTTGTKDKVTADVEIIYAAGGEDHHLIATGITFKAQGTSSLEYILAALNLDIDFSTATSWVNGTGAEITEYAMTENSIPVNYINLKANVASSESANNDVLADDYNDNDPYVCAPKAADARVRDCIEGYPCAVFFTNTSDAAIEVGSRTVAPDETILYFAGDFNNSKKNVAVFGQNNDTYPLQCCVEIKNNTELPCRFRSSDLSAEPWNGDGDFEFRFPEEYTDAMKDAFVTMQAWVTSTCRDLAPGTALAQAAIYGGKSYANDTAEYRAAKFLAEFDDYFVRDQMLFHYLFTERHCMTDNRAKNVFFCYEWVEDLQEYRWSVRCNYDNDTAEGCDNSGGATFTYGIEDTDIVGETPAFNASDSTIWVNIRDLMFDDLTTLYVELKGLEVWSAKRVIQKFKDHQAALPEAVRVEDAWNKYFYPWINKNQSAYAKQCHGAKEEWREQFEVYQEIYMDSKYCDTGDRSNAIITRATISSADEGDMTITPYSDLYVVVKYGNGGTVRVRVKRNEATKVECPTDSLGDTETYIYSASNLINIGSLASLKPKKVVADMASRLQSLIVGSEEAGYQNLNLTELSLGNNEMIEYLDLRGLPNLVRLMDMSALTSLEEFYANGSGITGVVFAKGAPLRIARLPAVASLVARDLDKLEKFVMDGTALASLWVENCQVIDTLALCKQATGLTRGRLIGVDWTDDNADVLNRLAKLQTAGGFDALGNSIDGFVLTGAAHCAVITEAEIAAINAAFPDLVLTYDQIVTSYTVTFQNWDGTTFEEATQTVRYGASAVNPVVAGMIETPTRPPTVANTYNYTGWDKSLDGIVADTVITAVFTVAVRYYTVRHWYDESESRLLQTKSVPAYGDGSYEGDDLTRSDGAVWAGWDKMDTNVQQDLDVHALFVLPELPDTVPAEFDYLYSNDPEDVSAYTAAEFYGILYHGKEREYFAIGDRIKLVTRSDKFADTAIVMELRSFKHFMSAERADDWAGPYFGMVGVMNATRAMNNANTNVGGFPAMTMPTFLNESVFPELPRFFRNMIEKIVVLSSKGGTSAEIVSMESYLTLESQAEVGFDRSAVPYVNEVAEGADEVTFSCYTDNASRIKKTYNGEGSASLWWLRSPLASSSTTFANVNSNGNANSNNATNALGVAFGFCLRSAITE